MTVGPTTASRRGRPRDADIDRRIVEATLRTLSDVGFRGTSIDRVATAAGIPRSSVYRRWHSKAELVVSVLAQTVPTIDDPASDDPLADLITMLTDFIVAFVGADHAAVVMTVHAEAHHDAALNTLVQDYLAPRGQVIDEVVRRAQRSGQITADLASDLIRDLVVGPALYRWLIPKQSVDRSTVHTLVTTALAALTP